MSTSEDKSPLSEAPDKGGMSCAQAHRQIERLVEDCDLKDIERALLMAHVRNCKPCKSELDCSRRLESRLKDALAPLDTAPHFSARVLAVLPESGSRDAPAWEKSQPAPRSLISARLFSSRRIGLRGSGHPVLLRCVVLTAGFAALAMLAVGIWQIWHRGGQTHTPPTIVEVSGQATRIRQVDTDSGVPLAVGEELPPSDSILAITKPVVLTLQCGPLRISKVALAPGSRLQALSRNSYRLASGAAYFEVHNDPSKAAPDEAFEVDAGGLATVRVTGTTFGVDLLPQAEGGVIVFVEQGAVQVQRAGLPAVPLAAGKQLHVTPAGPLPRPRPFDKAQRLAWLPGLSPSPKPQAPGLANTAERVAPPVAPATPLTPGFSRADMNWNVLVKGVPLLGMNLVEGIDALAEKLGKPAELPQLRSQLQARFVASTATLSFAVHNDMPLQAVLRWMARDLSARFADDPEGRKCFIPVAAHELPGPPDSGIPPIEIRRALEAPDTQNLPAAASLPTLIEGLSSSCGVTIILDRPLLEKYFAGHNPSLDLPGRTVGQKLDALLGLLHAGVAWYDYALYVAAPSRIEALTLTPTERWAAPGPQLLGRPLNPRWALELQNLLRAQTYPPERGAVAAPCLPGLQLRSDTALAGRPVCKELALDPNPADSPVLRYRTGLLGEALLSATLDALRAGSPAVPGIAAMISTPSVPGTVPDLKSLVEQARPLLHLELAQGLKPPPFDKQAFVNKNLRLGEALEWAAWLGGCGLRQDNNDVWVVDEAAACYGAPAMQVLSLASLAARNQVLAPELPGLFTRLLPELYPGFFSRTQFRCIGNRLVFTGDRRQLQVAQRLLTALEAANPASVEDARNWRPAWRVALERNLAEPFKSDPQKLNGSFLGLLRQSALGAQLRCSVLVTPAAMREKAGVDIHDLDVAGLSVGQVVAHLAEAAGLRMVLEGKVVWLRP